MKGLGLSAAAALLCSGASVSASYAAGAPPGWPPYLAMGAVGGPNISPPTKTSRGGDDDFGGSPVDVVFKYAGSSGNGDPGIIDPPTNASRMRTDLDALSVINAHPMRVAIVEYTAQLSGGFSTADFSNTSTPDPASGGTYLMARHLINVAADASELNSQPVTYKGVRYYGTLIMNPDLLGSIEQGGSISTVNAALPMNAVNTAVAEALCFLTHNRTYHNTSNPNGLQSAPYLNKTYTGSAVTILQHLLADTYPVWSINSLSDPYWNTATDNLIGGSGSNYSQIGTWFNECVASPTVAQAYKPPNFPAGFEGWVEANNWMIREFSPAGNVTFGWQDNMWATSSGYWLQKNLTPSGIAAAYATPVSNWLATNAPSAIKVGPLGSGYLPDYFVFDRYESDDSAGAGQATLYNARSWDNYLTAVGQVSAKFSNIPIMLWQIPGSHIPYVGEANPELYNNTSGLYVFSSAPAYFFGEPPLTANLSNIIAGSGSSINSEVGNYLLDCSATGYNCASGSTYKDYLGEYSNKSFNFNWGRDNRRREVAVLNHVFAILWGGGNTTNVIKNFSNTDDHGWLASKIINYYKRPTPFP